VTDFLLVAAIVLAALVTNALLQPRPPSPPARARARAHRPGIPPRTAPRPTPAGSGAARVDASEVSPNGVRPARSAPGRQSASGLAAGPHAAPQPRRSSPVVATATDREPATRTGPPGDEVAAGVGTDVPGSEADGRWSSPSDGAHGGRGRRAAVIGAVSRRLPGAARRERAAEDAAVPEVLDVLRATIVAGAAPYRALLAAAETAPEPLAPVLDAAARAAAVGLGPGQALARAGREQGLVELVVAGEALDLAETTGAPPAPVLAGVAAAATDRLRARQARMAATAQARLAARVVSGMAPCFLLVLAATSPADAAFLVRERLGWLTLAAAAAFEAAGIWWAGRIVGGGP
jgi:hypothetical protein